MATKRARPAKAAPAKRRLLKRYSVNVNVYGRSHKPDRYAGIVYGQHTSAAAFRAFVVKRPEFRGLTVGKAYSLD